MTRAGENPPAALKRFYSAVSVTEAANGFTVTLDGKPARTRARHFLATPSRSLAEALAAEWASQSERIDFHSMPMTRFRMTVIDRSEADHAEWLRATLAFLSSDLLCYRAASPRDLVQRQAGAFDPLLDWAASQGIRLRTGEGVGFIKQPGTALDSGARLLGAATPDELIAIKTAAEIAGSAVIAFALWRRAFPAEALFEASRTDEVFQAEKWGQDAEALARARRLKADFLDAARYSTLVSAA